MITNRVNKKIAAKYLFIMLVWIILITWSLVLYLINSRIDSIFILKPFRQIVLLILIISIVSRININYEDIYKIVIISAVINTIIICLQLYGHNILNEPNFMMPSSFVETVNVPYRKPGLMAGFPHAGLLSLIAIICLLNFIKSIKIIYLLTILPLLAFSLIVTSRTALVLSIIPFFFLFIDATKEKKILFRFLSLIIICFWAISVILSFLPQDTVNFAFEMFINYAEKNELSTASTKALNSSYVFPSHLATLLLGNGLYMRTDINTNIDDGYQVLIYGGGLFYFVVIILLFAYYFTITLNSSISKLQKRTIYLIYAILLIANYKVDCIFSRVISDILVLFLALSLNAKLISKYTVTSLISNKY